jgi:predicted ester cyclase
LAFETVADPTGVRHVADRLTSRRLSGGDIAGWIVDTHSPAAVLHAAHPINEHRGREAIEAELWQRVLRSFPDAELRTDLLLPGRFAGADWLATMGYVVGTLAGDLFGVRATGRPAWLRWGRFDRIDAGAAIETYLMFDLPALMIAGKQWPLGPSLGVEILPPPPATGDGVFRADDPEGSARSLALVEAMIAGLMSYDGRSLSSMGMRRFWTPDFFWYGPGGIGTARGHADYERAHQGPFLAAFPDRRGGNHKCRIADATYIASTGWPSIRATHSGGNWLGLASTGKPVGMRVMDFWRREGDHLAENWVFIDLLDLGLQLGIDILDRAAAMR